MEPIGCPETSVRDQPTLRDNLEDGRNQVNRSGSLQSRVDTNYRLFHLKQAPCLKAGRF